MAIEVRQLGHSIVAVTRGIGTRLLVVGHAAGGVAVVHRAARVVTDKDAEVVRGDGAAQTCVAVLHRAAVDGHKAANVLVADVLGGLQQVELRVAEAVVEAALLQVADEAAHVATRHVGDGDGGVDRRGGCVAMAHAADEAAHDGVRVHRDEGAGDLAVLHRAAVGGVADETADDEAILVLQREHSVLDEEVLHRAAVQLAHDAVGHVIAVQQAGDTSDGVAIAVERALEAVGKLTNRHPAVLRHVDVGGDVAHRTGMRMAGAVVDTVDIADEVSQLLGRVDVVKVLLIVTFRRVGDDDVRPETIQVDVVGVEDEGLVDVVHRHIVVRVVEQVVLQFHTRRELVQEVLARGVVLIARHGARLVVVGAVDDGDIVRRNAEAHFRCIADAVVDDGDDVLVVTVVDHRCRQVHVVARLVGDDIGIRR